LVKRERHQKPNKNEGVDTSFFMPYNIRVNIFGDNMIQENFKVQEHQIKDRSTRHKNYDILEKEYQMFLFIKSTDLKYCREYYFNGVGTRNVQKLKESNFGFDKKFKIVGYTTDEHGKVCRIFANKYDNSDGDDVSESILWPPNVGKKSILKYNSSREFSNN
jgi:hypothetical protein